MFILFTIHPYVGHFAPLAPLAIALEEAGHEVVFATTTAFAEEVVAGTGFSAVGAGVEPYHTFGWTVDVIRPKIADLLDVLGRRTRPNLILREVTDFSGLILGEFLDVPSVTIGAGIFQSGRWWRRLLRGALDAIRADYRLPLDPSCARLHPELYCDLVPPWFQQFEGSPPDTHWYVRSDRPLDTGPSPAWLRRLPDRPTVYVTLGTVYNNAPEVFRAVIHALSTEDVNVVCTTGRDQDPQHVFGREQPQNAHIERFIPAEQLLPNCDVLVTHGGYNTLMGALRHEVLPVVIPLGSDQPVNAQRCIDLGIGLRLDPQHLPPTAVRRAVHSLIGAEDRRTRLRRLQACEASLPGLTTAVVALERLARTRRPGQARTHLTTAGAGPVRREHPIPVARAVSTDPVRLAAAAVQRGALQKEEELAALLALLLPRRPRRILEIGSDAGGTLYAWRQLGAEVIGITLPDGPYRSGVPLRCHGATVLEGDSHHPRTIRAVSTLLGQQPVNVLFVDGDHSYAGVRADVASYLPFVAADGLVVLHDICQHPGRPEVAVHRYWQGLRNLPGSLELVSAPRSWGGIGVAVAWVVGTATGVAPRQSVAVAASAVSERRVR
jgi:UDP:flavonoid glycosyltransferase YjiC (YdhE family)